MVPSRKIYFVAWLRAGGVRLGVSVEESCARGQPTFAGAEWRGKFLAGSQCLMSWKGVAQLVLATGLCSSMPTWCTA